MATHAAKQKLNFINGYNPKIIHKEHSQKTAINLFKFSSCILNWLAKKIASLARNDNLFRDCGVGKSSSVYNLTPKKHPVNFVATPLVVPPTFASYIQEGNFPSFNIFNFYQKNHSF